MGSTQYRLNQRPSGIPSNDVWQITHDSPAPLAEGHIAVDVEYISVDPAMRGWMNDVPSYIPPVQIGEVMRAGGVGYVTASRSEKFSVGDAVVGTTGVQTQYVGPVAGFNKVLPEFAPLQKFLGGLGMPGMTAYFGLLDIGDVKEGETVLISGAGGAVGSVAGQIAKVKRCRVIGIAGGPEKCAAVIEKFGFDECLDYKAPDFSTALKAACPKGVDVYFDNVGGKILDYALANMAMNGRIVLCGAISQYNSSDGMRVDGPSNYLQLLVKRARMEGFVVFDYQKRFPEAIMQMLGWMGEGSLRLDETVVEGIDTFPAALRMLFEGGNFGKLMIKVKE